VILIAAGVVTYLVVSSTLADQHITVADDAAPFAGEEVNQPWEAYAQADIIGEHATEIADGQTYAQLPQDDPNRAGAALPRPPRTGRSTLRTRSRDLIDVQASGQNPSVRPAPPPGASCVSAPPCSY
jgi:hypothetical protein